MSDIKEIVERNLNSFEFRNDKCLNAFMDFSPIPIILFDKDWKIKRWSKKAEDVFGWSESEVLDKTIKEFGFIYKEDWHLIEQVENETKIYKCVRKRNRNYRKDGSVVICDWENVRLENDDGIVYGYLTFSSDVSVIEETKKKIEESRLYFETFVESLPFPVFYLNPDVMITNFNHTFEKFFINEIRDDKLYDLREINAKPKEHLIQLYTQLKTYIKSDDKNLVTDVKLVCSDEILREFFVSFIKHFNLEGQFKGIFGFFIDVTKINILSRELNESIKLYQNLFHTSSDGIVFISDDLKIIDANSTFCEIIGENYKNIKSKNINELINLNLDFANLTETFLIEEIELIKPDAKKKYLNAKIWPKYDFFKNKNGYWIIFRDITKARELRNELIETQRRYEIAVDCSNDGLWEWDIINKKLWLSPKLKEILEIDNSEQFVSNDFIVSLIHPNDFEYVVKSIEENFINRNEFEIEFRLKDSKTNEYRWYGVKGKLLLDEMSNPIKMAGNLRDINEKKLLQDKEKLLINELKRSNDELQQFAYVASHDLQEPLRMISSFLQLFKKRYYHTLNAEASEFINYALDGSIRMQQMINDLLTFSRIKTRPGRFEQTDVNKIIHRVVETLKLTIKEKSASIYYNELPNNLVCDEGQIFQLFMNLISNAIKFSKKDCRPEILISCEENNDDYIFKVKDNGIGIDEQYKDRIFQIFQRLHTRDEYPGNGIGLAICKRIVQRHNGTITFESIINQGTTFIFTIAKNLKDEAYEF